MDSKDLAILNAKCIVQNKAQMQISITMGTIS